MGAGATWLGSKKRVIAKACQYALDPLLPVVGLGYQFFKGDDLARQGLIAVLVQHASELGFGQPPFGLAAGMETFHSRKVFGA